jgi:hypothetical protein
LATRNAAFLDKNLEIKVWLLKKEEEEKEEK